MTAGFMGVLLCGWGCVPETADPSHKTEVVVDSEPPAPVLEAATVSPGFDYVWVAGEWGWHGHWVWEKGHWGRPPHAGAQWVPHHYGYENGHYVFVRGGWN